MNDGRANSYKKKLHLQKKILLFSLFNLFFSSHEKCRVGDGIVKSSTKTNENIQIIKETTK